MARSALSNSLHSANLALNAARLARVRSAPDTAGRTGGAGLPPRTEDALRSANAALAGARELAASLPMTIPAPYAGRLAPALGELLAAADAAAALDPLAPDRDFRDALREVRRRAGRLTREIRRTRDALAGRGPHGNSRAHAPRTGTPAAR